MEREIQSQGKLEEFIESSPLFEAYALAEKAHEGKLRAEGIPYFTHCKAVEKIISGEWGITNLDLRKAALLHDTIEDTCLKLTDIEKEFGPKVAFLVEGVSQLRSEKENGISKVEKDRETIKKILNRHTIDAVVSVLKLADRLHNMRTLNFMPKVNQIPKARETADVYAPLAESLGIWVVKTELEDLSLKYTDPKAYKKFSRLLARDPRLNPKFIDNIKSELEYELEKFGINAEVATRVNSIARLRSKADRAMFRDINDVISFRVILDNKDDENITLQEVYRTFGIIRQKYLCEEDPKRLDDFYGEKRDNEYSAIQLTIQKPEGAIEIAITSKEREEFNNWGVISLMRRGVTDLRNHSLKLVITSRGPVKFTKPDASGVDLAYLISRDFGLQEEGMLIDGVRHKITEDVPNGANLDIILGKMKNRPHPRLIKAAHLENTKRAIEKQNLQADKEKLIKKGKNTVSEIIKKRGILDLADLHNSVYFPEQAKTLNRLLYRLGCNGQLPELYYQIASGLNIKLLESELDQIDITKEKMGFTSIMVRGTDKPGVLQLITSNIRSLGGNVRFNHGGVNGKYVFEQRMIVENLSREREKELAEIFQTDSRITKVIIV
jgi:GTP pyrophosphokinase